MTCMHKHAKDNRGLARRWLHMGSKRTMSGCAYSVHQSEVNELC
jgi:hypothetical protein